MTFAFVEDFVSCYSPENRFERRSKWSDERQMGGGVLLTGKGCRRATRRASIYADFEMLQKWISTTCRNQRCWLERSRKYSVSVGISTAVATLGSRLIEFHSQNKTVAASMIAEKKVSGHRSYRVATRLQSFNRPNMISMRLRRL